MRGPSLLSAFARLDHNRNAVGNQPDGRTTGRNIIDRRISASSRDSAFRGDNWLTSGKMGRKSLNPTAIYPEWEGRVHFQR
jgi:hypothetical protein